MKKLLILFLLMVSIATLNAEKIRIGWFALEPFIIDPGQGKPPTGATIEYYGKYLVPKMGLEVEWVGPFPFTRLTEMLEKQEIDAIAQFTKTAEREAKFLFPQTPLTHIVTCIMVNKDNPLTKITKADDLFNTTIGYFETGFIPPMLKNDKIKFDLTKSQDYRKINLEKLLAKRFEAMLDINYLSMAYYLKVNGYSDKVKVLLLPVDPVAVYCMFVKSEKGARFVKLYDKANADLIKQKTFEGISKKYLQ